MDFPASRLVIAAILAMEWGMRTPVLTALSSQAPMDEINVCGWVRTKRDAKAFSFLELNDGSCLRGIQVVVDTGTPGSEALPEMTTGASVEVKGRLVASQGKEQAWEIQATWVGLLGTAGETYPLQKKGHSLEFLREIAHLRPRSNLFGAVFRVRSRMAYAVHTFFQERGFFNIHTPMITASDCEGAGEMFRVTTLPPGSAAKPETDFFGKPAFLTVSGQLEAETMACALGKVYTFGPTFRAENSNTSRHAAEFWMIEPEQAFCDLSGNMDLAEAQLKHQVTDALTHCAEDLAFFSKYVDRELLERLRFVAERPFERISYTEAVKLLEASGHSFEYPVKYGLNLQSEHERWLTEKHFQCPVIVYNYPKEIKPFYMRQNDDGTTVAAMDVLVPGIGEIIGGSQREERPERLSAAMAHHGLSEADYWWYADLRKFGTVPHAGYGMGFERLLMFVTGVGNIRDVIPFARTPGHAEF
ncbi:MAG: asns: asparagine--trna ligase [Verrucomicrobiales bacterium]|nr:asns: asparagine--trna ligase [Verrucomicrobiales bacterium]